jgi:hypothetical protein
MIMYNKFIRRIALKTLRFYYIQALFYNDEPIWFNRVVMIQQKVNNQN